jgi:hypothetical protein
MGTQKIVTEFFGKLAFAVTRACIVAGFLLSPLSGQAQFGFGGGNSSPTYAPLNSWSFQDRTNWTSDKGYAPVSFTNLDFSSLGNGASLVVSSTNPAWLNFNVVETNGATNLTVDTGTVMFWFAPSWSGTNQDGTGPGVSGRLLEVGSFTPDASFGWWSLYVDPDGANLYFSAQTNDLSSNVVTYLSAPIVWTTNYFHHVAVTYSATNTALYLDGSLATNGPPLTVFPGAEVLAKGFYIGSDSHGLNQAQGMFNSVATYEVPLDADTIGQIFSDQFGWHMMNPLNQAMFSISSAEASAAMTITATPNVITGQGNLQVIGTNAICVSSANQYKVWITNVTASVAGNGTVNVTFSIQGGQDGYYYDVFAGVMLTSPLGKGLWTWQGQGQHCRIYSLSNLPRGTVFLILGTPVDTDFDGLTDAYENLMSKTNPNLYDTDADDIGDGWEVLLRMNPLANENSSPSRINYDYTSADWLKQISGLKTGAVSLDNEGNVLQVSQ